MYIDFVPIIILIYIIFFSLEKVILHKLGDIDLLIVELKDAYRESIRKIDSAL